MSITTILDLLQPFFIVTLDRKQNLFIYDIMSITTILDLLQPFFIVALDRKQNLFI
jgi:hypothetical protein